MIRVLRKFIDAFHSYAHWLIDILEWKLVKLDKWMDDKWGKINGRKKF